MTREEMVRLAIETLKKGDMNEVELEGAVADSNVNFKVHLVKVTPVPWISQPYALDWWRPGGLTVPSPG